MAILDDAAQSGRDTWHAKKAWTPNILTLGIAVAFLGLAGFAWILGGFL